MLVFEEGGKTGGPGEKSLGARTTTNNKLNQHMTPGPGIEPGHIGGRRVLSPLRSPKKRTNSIFRSVYLKGNLEIVSGCLQVNFRGPMNSIYKANKTESN